MLWICAGNHWPCSFHRANRQAHAHSAENGLQALEFRVSGGRKSTVSRFAIEPGGFRHLFHADLRFVGMPNAIAANMRQIIYGGILVFMMFRYSRGFGGECSLPTRS